MKIEQEKGPFRPVTITLETVEEVDKVRNNLTRGIGLENKDRNFLVTIANYLNCEVERGY